MRLLWPVAGTLTCPALQPPPKAPQQVQGCCQENRCKNTHVKRSGHTRDAQTHTRTQAQGYADSSRHQEVTCSGLLGMRKSLPTLRPLQSPPEGWESGSDQDCPQLILLTVSRLLPQAFPCWLGEKTKALREKVPALPLTSMGRGDSTTPLMTMRQGDIWHKTTIALGSHSWSL